MLERLAMGDPWRLARLMMVPLCDCLTLYQQLLREDAEREYRTVRLMWAMGVRSAGSGDKTMPKPPAILEESP